MPPIHKTIQNPHGLSAKQKLVIEDMVNDVKHGKRMDALKSTKLFYGREGTTNLAPVSSHNLNKDNFRMALIEKLANLNIIGENSKIAKRLNEGIDATKHTKSGVVVDHGARLAYIKEVNKITGVYAPTLSQKKTLNVKINMTDKEYHDKLQALKEELTQQ